MESKRYTCAWVDLSFVHRQGLCLNTLCVQPFYSVYSGNPGKIFLCRWQNRDVEPQRTKSKARTLKKELVRHSTLTAWSRPCRRWFRQSSASGNRGYWLWSSPDTCWICKHQAQQFRAPWGNSFLQSCLLWQVVGPMFMWRSCDSIKTCFLII